MDKVKIITQLDDVKNELSKMISYMLMAGGIPGRLLDIDTKIDEIKASIAEA